MQCNWFTVTSFLRRRAGRYLTTSHPRIPLNSTGLHELSSKPYSSSTSPTTSRDGSFSFNNFVASAVRHTVKPIEPFAVPDIQAESGQDAGFTPSLRGPPTKARLSQAVAQTVRLAFRSTGTIPAAYLVVKSVVESQYMYRDDHPRPPRFQVAVDFRQAVSPRLSYHCLLHGLVRNGSSQKAGEVVREMMNAGIEVHPRSLSKALRALCMDPSLAGDSQVLQRLSDVRVDFRAPKLFSFPTEMAKNPGTQLAVSLLIAASNFQKQRLHQAFTTLIDACLLQGEIIVASFLFAFLVKQLQMRTAPCPSPDSEVETDENFQDGDILERVQPKYIKTPGHHLRFPRPQSSTLSSILNSINNSFDANPASGDVVPSRHEGIYALTTLTILLEEGLLNFVPLSTFISTMYSCPSGLPVKVMMKDAEGEWGKANAQKYIKRMLHRLIDVSLSDQSKPPDTWSTTVRKRMDRRAYNSLLHYALRYRYSTKLAYQILERMTMEEDPSRRPDIVTYNILIRMGTLLRRNDIVDKALGLLRARPENATNLIMIQEREYSHVLDNVTYDTTGYSSDDLDLLSCSSLTSLPTGHEELAEKCDVTDYGLFLPGFDGVELQDAQNGFCGISNPDDLNKLYFNPEERKVAAIYNFPNIAPIPRNKPSKQFQDLKDTVHTSKPEASINGIVKQLQFEEFSLPVPESATKLEADMVTLASYILHLTSSGKPEVVVEVLFNLIPQLKSPEYPSDTPKSREEIAELKDKQELAGLQRAIRCGPTLLTIILNALVKAGRTGLAERVWILAKTAERCSWDPDFVPGVQPWVLSIAAYTVMMQCYALEGRKAYRIYDSPKKNLKLAIELDADAKRDGWRPRTRHLVKGWAYYLFAKGLPSVHGSRTRVGAARDAGLLLFRSMKLGAADVFVRLNDMTSEALTVPPGLAVPIADRRFYNAALELFGRQPGRNRRARRVRKSDLEKRMKLKQRQFARYGSAPSMFDPTLLDILQAMDEAGLSIPYGYRHILIGIRTQALQREYDSRVDDEESSPFPPVKQLPFRPYAVQTIKTRGLPLRKIKRLGVKVG